MHEGENLPSEYVSKLSPADTSSQQDLGVVLSTDATISPRMKFPPGRDDVATFAEGSTVHILRRMYSN